MSVGPFRVLVAGQCAAPVLRLAAPLSFWGGVDPATGKVSDPRHPDHGAAIAGACLVVPGTIGSSSSSAVMLELMASGRAPAALILAEVDAILVLGVIVAKEMGYGAIPVLAGDLAGLATGQHATVAEDGTIGLASGPLKNVGV